MIWLFSYLRGKIDEYEKDAEFYSGYSDLEISGLSPREEWCKFGPEIDDGPGPYIGHMTQPGKVVVKCLGGGRFGEVTVFWGQNDRTEMLSLILLLNFILARVFA